MQNNMSPRPFRPTARMPWFSQPSVPQPIPSSYNMAQRGAPANARMVGETPYLTGLSRDPARAARLTIQSRMKLPQADRRAAIEKYKQGRLNDTEHFKKLREATLARPEDPRNRPPVNKYSSTGTTQSREPSGFIKNLKQALDMASNVGTTNNMPERVSTSSESLGELKATPIGAALGLSMDVMGTPEKRDAEVKRLEGMIDVLRSRTGGSNVENMRTIKKNMDLIAALKNVDAKAESMRKKEKEEMEKAQKKVGQYEAMLKYNIKPTEKEKKDYEEAKKKLKIFEPDVPEQKSNIERMNSSDALGIMSGLLFGGKKTSK